MLNDSSEKASTPTSEIKKGTATFTDNVLTLAGGTALGLGVTVLASPITSRLFGPEAFGLAALFRSSALMLAAIACLRYEMAIVLPKKDEDAAALFALCCSALVVMTIFAAVLTEVFGNRVLLYLNAVGLRPILWLFPVYVFLMGSQLPLRFWYTRQKQFKINAAGSILGSFPISMAEITGGWAGFRTGEDLVVIRIFGLIFAPAFFVWQLFRGDAGFIIRNINPGVIIKSAKRYIKFPMLDIWSVLLAYLGVNVPILLLTAFFSPAVCGLYAKALYLLHLPSIVIGHSVGQVFLQESAAAKAGGKNLAGLVDVVFNRMITLGTYPFALLLIISPELFGLFLGARWTESGIYSQILMPQLFIGFLMGSITTLFGTLGKQGLNLISRAVSLMLRLATLTFGGLILRDVRLTLLIFMVANVLMGLWRMSLLIRATKVSARRPLVHFVRCIAYVVPSVVPLAVMKWWFGLEAIYLVALTPIFSLPYIALVLRQDLELRNLFSNYLQRVLLFKR
jgi:O-antigen/teichoic acid export membrane protein